ncbi:helix-turn-helix domain-containing protein [Halorarius litoreus]|uniref:helix-turn-helix domain-containing protein n=1 Tax=Halorarius litoreus TaxID=2962676 RepID=UPI0020CB9F38|nr:helix-turn-helix domain-containing protein [Halorarius litoreus]
MAVPPPLQRPPRAPRLSQPLYGRGHRVPRRAHLPLEEDQDATYTFDLTPEQQTALVAAVEGGFFGVRRGITLTEIAEDLSISQQAASERIRRAEDTVLRAVLMNRSAADF